MTRCCNAPGLERWACRRKVSLEDILLAQIESHRAEVFYNLDPVRYDSDFVRKLPGCVRKAIAWRNIPSPAADFGGYDFIVCNSPTLLRTMKAAAGRLRTSRPPTIR